MIYAGKNTASRGFTIVELVVVIVVIAILAAITVVSYAAVTRNAHEQDVIADVQTAATQLSKYKNEHGAYPATSADALAAIAAAQTSSTFTYNYTATTDTYCLTATHEDISEYMMSGSSKVTAGTCPASTTATPEVITNIAPNPSAEVNANDWVRYAGVGTVTRTTTTAAKGSASLTAVGDGSSTTPRFYTDVVDIVPNATYAVSFYVKSVGGPVPAAGVVAIKPQASPHGSEMTTITTEVPWAPDANGWTRVAAVVTAPSGAKGFRLSLGLKSPSYTGTMYIDGLMVVKSADKTLKYADGSTAGWSWKGAAHNSLSSGPMLP